MNKQYFRNRSSRSSGFMTGGGVAAALCVGVLAVLLLIRIVAPNVLIALASPLWGAGSWVQTQLSGSASSEDLQAELMALRAENATLAARATDLQTLLGSRASAPPALLAGVRMRPPISPYDVLVVDQGTVAGVQVGARVYGAGGTPIGAVTEVSAYNGRVTLFSTRGSNQPAWAGTARIPIDLTGNGSGSFSATVQNESGIIVGDTVFLADTGAVPIGTIVALEEDASAPRTVLYVRPYINPFSLTWVTIEPVLP